MFSFIGHRGFFFHFITCNCTKSWVCFDEVRMAQGEGTFVRRAFGTGFDTHMLGFGMDLALLQSRVASMHAAFFI